MASRKTMRLRSNHIDMKTRTLVFGFVRHFEYVAHNNTVAPLIFHLCLVYYFIGDQWDSENKCKYYEIIAAETCIRRQTKNDGGDLTSNRSAMLKTQIDSSLSNVIKYLFKIEFKEYKYGYILIGIWKSNKFLKSQLETFLNDQNDNGYGYVTNCGYLTNINRPGYPGKKYGKKQPCIENNDIIEMTVDFNELTISYKVNDTDYGVAWSDIDDTKYLVGITTYYAETKVTLLSVSFYDK